MGRKKLGLTGSSVNFKIIVIPVGSSPIVFSFTGGYHTQLDEYEVGTATRHKYNDGSKRKKVHYIEKEWVLDYSNILPTEEGVMLGKIQNHEIELADIFIMPHDDADISYKALIIEDKRKLSHYQNEYSTSKGYIIAFENADPILRYNKFDPGNKVFFTADEMDFV